MSYKKYLEDLVSRKSNVDKYDEVMNQTDLTGMVNPYMPIDKYGMIGNRSKKILEAIVGIKNADHINKIATYVHMGYINAACPPKGDIGKYRTEQYTAITGEVGCRRPIERRPILHIETSGEGDKIDGFKIGRKALYARIVGLPDDHIINDDNGNEYTVIDLKEKLISEFTCPSSGDFPPDHIEKHVNAFGELVCRPPVIRGEFQCPPPDRPDAIYHKTEKDGTGVCLVEDPDKISNNAINSQRFAVLAGLLKGYPESERELMEPFERMYMRISMDKEKIKRLLHLTRTTKVTDFIDSVTHDSLLNSHSDLISLFRTDQDIPVGIWGLMKQAAPALFTGRVKELFTPTEFMLTMLIGTKSSLDYMFEEAEKETTRVRPIEFEPHEKNRNSQVIVVGGAPSKNKNKTTKKKTTKKKDGADATPSAKKTTKKKSVVGSKEKKNEKKKKEESETESDEESSDEEVVVNKKRKSKKSGEEEDSIDYTPEPRAPRVTRATKKKKKTDPVEERVKLLKGLFSF